MAQKVCVEIQMRVDFLFSGGFVWNFERVRLGLSSSQARKKSVKSHSVLLPGNGNYHLVDRFIVPRTFFQNIGQIVCHFDRLSLLIPKPFEFWKTDVPDSRNRQKTSKNSIKILIFQKRPKSVFSVKKTTGTTDLHENLSGYAQYCFKSIKLIIYWWNYFKFAPAWNFTVLKRLSAGSKFSKVNPKTSSFYNWYLKSRTRATK